MKKEYIYKLLFAIAVIVYCAITDDYGTGMFVIGAVGTQTVVTGTRTTSNVNTDMRVRDVENTIALLEPYQTPIEDFFFSGDFPEEVVTHPRSKFEWFEDAFLPDTMTLVDAIAGGATESNIVVSGNYFLAGDTVLIEATGEMVRVTAVDTANTEIDIAKIGATNFSAAAAGTILQRIVPAFVENGSKQSSLTVQAVGKSGYTQILKKGLSATGRQRAGNYYGGNDWKYQWRKALKEIKEAVERMYLYNGVAYDDTSGDITHSAGFLGTLTTNSISYAGDLDEVEFDDGISQIFDAGGSSESSNRRVVLCGSGALKSINKFIKAKYELRDTTMGAGSLEKYGPVTTAIRRPKIMTYFHAQGELDLVWEPQLKNKYTNSMLVIDPANVKRRYMADEPDKGPRKYRREMGIETPGADSYDAQYLFDIGLQIRLEETMGWFHKS